MKLLLGILSLIALLLVWVNLIISEDYLEWKLKRKKDKIVKRKKNIK